MNSVLKAKDIDLAKKEPINFDESQLLSFHFEGNIVVLLSESNYEGKWSNMYFGATVIHSKSSNYKPGFYSDLWDCEDEDFSLLKKEFVVELFN